MFATRLRLPIVAVVVLASAWATHPAVAAFPGKNGAIAYTRNDRIWLRLADGSEVRLGLGAEPSFSPDGTRIAFLRYGRRTGNANIWTMDADGANKVRVTSERAFEAGPAWSPDGSKLVYDALRASTGYELYVISSTAPFGEPVQITSTLDQEEEDPRWSPDGTRIAFQVISCPPTALCGTQIGVVNADGSGYRTLTPQVGDEEGAPDWSPDSSTLVFDSDRDAGPSDSDIYSIPAGGGTVTRITHTGGDAMRSIPVWSPDGTRLLCAMQPATGRTTLQVIAFGSGSVTDLGPVGDLYAGVDWQALP
jgi:Tol biopolymer transport system component